MATMMDVGCVHCSRVPDCAANKACSEWTIDRPSWEHEVSSCNITSLHDIFGIVHKTIRVYQFHVSRNYEDAKQGVLDARMIRSKSVNGRCDQ
jgi:hypothetical protein